jgi:tetratricopeptide (TPR) repeat protein
VNIRRIALYLCLAVFLVSAGYLYYQMKMSPQASQEEHVTDSPLSEEISEKLEVPDNATSKAKTTKMLNNAIKKFNKEDFNGALELFLEISDSDARALSGVGLAYVKLEDYDRGIDYLEKALSMGEDKFIVRKFISYAYYMTNDLEMSALHAKAALDMHEEDDLRNLYKKIVREQRSQENSMTEEALHFKVVYDGNVHSDISRDILEILEDAYDEICGQILHFPDITITVILYSEKDFAELTSLPVWVMGSYDGKIRVPVKDIQKQQVELLRKVLYHEYVHAFIHTMTPEIPLWINEGLAEHLVPRGLERTNQVIPLRDLEQEFPMGDAHKAKIAYRESFSAVSYLVENYSIHTVREFLLSLGQGKSLNEAFEYAFFITYDEFVSTWGKDGL